MTFEKGSRVEVMKKTDMPITWHEAEILAANEHSYSVMYGYHPGIISESMVDRVSKEFVRPCAPRTQGTVTWKVGDIVEVFGDFSWKVATILKVLQGDEYFVRLLGTASELTIHRLNIRERWLWQDDKWILMGKSSGACGVMRDKKLLTSNFNSKTSFLVPQSKKRKQIAAYTDIQKEDVLQDSNKVSSRSLKRISPYCSTSIASRTGNIQKIRVTGGKVGRKQMVDRNLSMEKVDAVAYPREILGEKYMHASFNNRRNGHNEPDGAVGCSLAEGLETNDPDRDASSVGSCSIVSKRQKRFHSNFLPVSCRVTGSFCSDAESFCGPESEKGSCSLPLPPEEVATSIHDLELHAYCSTLEALHASGPLSWEQETLLTNLRIMLHISNDEHLVEVRKLLSAKTGTYIR